MRKIETLRAYLDREKNNLENLKANSRGDHRLDIKKAETTIKTLQHQLQIQFGEVSVKLFGFLPKKNFESRIGRRHYSEQGV